MVTLKPLTSRFGYEVRDIDLAEPLAPAVAELMRGALSTRGLLLFRNQQLTDEQQARFARTFGNISRQGSVQKLGADVAYVSNSRSDGVFGKGELGFHADQLYFDHPMKAIMLFGLEVPSEGGETLFSASFDVVNRMPAELKSRLESAEVVNRMDYGELSYGDAVKDGIAPDIIQSTHSALPMHEPSQQRIHFISEATTKEIVSMPDDEFQTVMREVSALVGDEEHVYRHQWREGDLLVWDNILMQHARAPFEPTARRTLRRCAIANDLEPRAEGVQG